MIGLIIGGTVVGVYLLSGVKLINQRHRGLVERWGGYNRLIKPGFNWIIPGVEHLTRVNITERMRTIEQQGVITKDGLNTQINAQVYFKVRDDEESIKATQYNADEYKKQMVNIAITTLRNIMGGMTLMEANSGRDIINSKLKASLTTEAHNWGIEIIKTEIKEIIPPRDVQDAMNEVIKAENKRTATIIDADAKATAIKKVNESAQKYFKKDAQKFKALDVTQRSLEKNSKIILTDKGMSPNIIIGNDGVIPVTKKKNN